MRNMPQISIIIPVYNIDIYLRECIDSVLQQTFQDFEIILVDDGSTDSSGDICDEYEKKDSRIRTIHNKSNMGLSCARNYGIDVSRAPYIMFVDGDDWIEPEFCELPYKAAIKNNSDIVLFLFYKMNNGNREKPSTIFEENGLLTEKEAIHFLTSTWDAIWLGLYRRELFDVIRFPTGKIYEDTGTSHRLMHEARQIELVNECLYNYRVGRKGSITTNPRTRNHPDRREMHYRRFVDLSNWGYDDEAKKEALFLAIKYGVDESIADALKKGNNSGLSTRQKIMLKVFELSPRFFDIVCIAMRKRLSAV